MTKLMDDSTVFVKKKRRTSFGIPSDFHKTVSFSSNSLSDAHSELVSNNYEVKQPSQMSTKEIEAALQSLEEDVNSETILEKNLYISQKKRVGKGRSSLIDESNILEDDEENASSNTRRSKRLMRKSSIKNILQMNSNHNSSKPSSPIKEEPISEAASHYQTVEEMPESLLDIYQNKDYVEPSKQPLETIYEVVNNRIKRPLSAIRSIDFDCDVYQRKKLRRQKARAKRFGFKGFLISNDTESKFQQFIDQHEDSDSN